MQKLNQSYTKSVVKKALDEDLKPRGDITTNLIKFKNKKAKAQIVAKQDGIIAGLDFCKTAFKLVGKETIFISKVKDGAKVKKNKVIAEIKAKTNINLVNVFVPTTPNPTSGFLLMIPKDDLIYLDMTFEEASKFIVSAGTSKPKS